MAAEGWTRRQWVLSGAGAGLSLLAGCAAPPMAAVESQSSRQVALLVDRVTWGVNDAELDKAMSLGFDAYLREQLAATPGVLPPAVQERVAAMEISKQSAQALAVRMEEQRKAVSAAADGDPKRIALEAYQKETLGWIRECVARHLLRATYSPTQVIEQMTWFWLNHFSVNGPKGLIRASLADYEDTLRTRSLGRFRDLLGAVAHHPAMLQYLDNASSAAGRINENYARELMELHTLGVDAGYTQEDVQELARVLTGVGVNVGDVAPRVRRDLQGFYVREGLFEFNPNRHDFGPKRLLGQPITTRGLAELDEALDRLARHPAAARFISRKLAVFWMSDDPPQAVVDAMARTFRASDGRIADVLRTLFDQPAFWRARKFKDPMRFVVSAVRAAWNDRVPADLAPMNNWLQRMGEVPYAHATPEGYPLVAGGWNSSGQLATRFEIARVIGSLAPGSVDRVWRTASLGTATRDALAQAKSAQEWNTFFFASPEFNQR